MEKNEFLEQLKTLAANEDILAVSREINELKSAFEDFTIEEERQRQIAYLEAQERGENTEYEEVISPIKDEFYAVYNEYKERRNELLKKRKEERASNYLKKTALLERLKKLIEEEENIKASYDISKEIHEKWNAIGEVEREKDNELQSEYSRLRDSFFTNLSIFKELRDYDLKKNLEEKEEVIRKVEKLKTEEDIKSVEVALKLYRNKFDETGPVPSEEWERIRDAFWGNVREVYARVHEFYEGKRELLKENIEKKKVLLNEVTAFNSSINQLNSPKSWEQATQQLIAFQEQWKNIGFGLKKENEELWKLFREQCNYFFEVKRSFYNQMKAGFDEKIQAKKKLIREILALKEDTDWKNTTKKIIDLQAKWKSIGHAGNKNEQILWKEFRTACDDYFKSKDAFFEDRNKEEKENLTAKLVVIEKVNEYITPEDKNQLLADMKEFSRAFSLIGKVPFKEKDTIYKSFKTAIDKHYKNLNLNEKEKSTLLFQAEVTQMKAAPNAAKLLDDKKQFIRNDIRKIKEEALQYENNLSFFSGNKERNPLYLQAEKKLNELKNKIEDLKSQLKQLNE